MQNARRSVISGSELADLVLVVDDTEDTRTIYSDYFAYAGLRVAVAVDGDHALWKVFSLMPAVVVMDLAMPVLDGWEATRAIKSNPKTKHIPVIVLTGHVEGNSLKRAGDAGADAVLVKPCTPMALFEVVKQFLDR